MADGHGSDALERVYAPASRKAREADGQPPRNEVLPFALMLIDSLWNSFKFPLIGNEIVRAKLEDESPQSLLPLDKAALNGEPHHLS
jgi:hypothetical protein